MYFRSVRGAQVAKLAREFGVCVLPLTVNRSAVYVLIRIKQILAPLFVALAEQAHQVTAGVEAERAWRAKEFHAGLFGCAIALSIVTPMTTGDQIFPSGLAGARTRDDMVQGHLAGR